MSNREYEPLEEGQWTGHRGSHERRSSIESLDDMGSVEDLTVPEGTVLGACVNITNTILGTGMLAMPYAIAHVGLVQGVLMILFAAMLSAFGLSLLSHCAQMLQSRRSSFFACTKAAIPKAAVAFDAAIAVKCFGVSVSYLIVAGDLMPVVMQGLFSPNSDSILLSKVFWITLGVIIIGPVSFAKRLDSLKYTSMLALSAVVYLVMVVVGFALFPSKEMSPPSWEGLKYWSFDVSVLRILPIFVFAFTCHQNIFAVHNELEDNAYPNVRRVISYSVFTACLTYLLLGLVGLATFGVAVSSNIIAMYPPGLVVTGGQFAIVILVLLSYPLQCFPCRNSLDKVLTNGQGSELKGKRFNLLTLSILSASYLIAVTVNDLSTVLALVGATGSTTICYILPGLLYYKMSESSLHKYSSHSRRISLGLATFGVLVMVVCVSVLVFSESPSH